VQCVSDDATLPQGVSGLRSSDWRVQRVISLFEGLCPADIPRLGQIYHPQARFKDPFNDVRGVPAIAAIFAHMFKQVEAPRFAVIAVVPHADEAFLTWDFNFVTKGRGGRPMRIHGASHLMFDEHGLVTLHRDYWDAAEELYEKLPVLGRLMRWLKRQSSASV
jgi:hypothetical protein